MMSDLIDRQAAINADVKMASEGLEWVPVYHLKDLPSAEPERTAKVENHFPTKIRGYACELGSCSACGAAVIKPDKYCSECGCRLDWSEG